MHLADEPLEQTGAPPAWLLEAIDAVEQWRHEIGGKGRNAADRPVKIGPVQADAERSGWFSLPLRGRTVDSERLEEAFLAPADGPRETKYAVRDSARDGDMLRVLAMAGAAAEGLFLWAPAQDREALAKALAERLSAVVDATGLHEAFGRRRLDPIQACRAEPPGLDADQRRAFEACVSPGLQLVWGPPGTGKTEIIARAVEYLIRNGKSVLLVSGTNVAVDNALQRAASRVLGPDEGGLMVRVGTPHVLAVAEDARMSLSELRRQRQQEKEDERAAVEQQILELQRHPAKLRVVEAEERLHGFDLQAYEEARTRLANQATLDRIAQRCSDQQLELERREEALALATDALSVAEDRWSKTARRREALARRSQLADEMEGYQVERARALASHRSALEEIETAILEEANLPRSLRARGRRKEAAQRTALARERAARAEAALADREEVLRTIEPTIGRKIRQAEEEAAGLTSKKAEQLESELRARRQERGRAEDARNDARRRSGSLGEQLVRAGSAPQPTDEDHAIVTSADSGGLLDLHRRLPGIRAEAGRVDEQIEVLTAQHERLLKQLRDLGRDAEREILAEASLVATTLSMSRMKPAIHGRRYDFVIIDETAASALAELVHAVSLADLGAVMLGDFMQNAPIVEGNASSRHPAVQTWLAMDCFTFFGVKGPKTIVNGCVALSRQRRFGHAIAELANLVAYDGMLHTEGAQESRIVFVDVDGLGDDYVKIRKNPGGSGQWWVVGALLARALTEYHVAVHGERGAGVVTPYRIQKETIDAILADVGASELIEVSTSHGFQGREFDTIVFDLVEDGRGWVAAGSADGDAYALGGLRLFNVAVTRARTNLYLIGNGVALDAATSGPLHAVKQLINRGAIEVVAARDVLGRPAPQPQEGPAFEVWDATRTYVKVVGVYDEDVIPGKLLEHIKRARSSVWVWSPWVGRRVEDFLPELSAAQSRGVKVRVMALPTDEVSKPLHGYLRQLRQQIDHVVFVKKEHQKLVIIDERLTFIGSMNVLSHSGNSGRREVMTLIESSDFARRMLAHERADEFAKMRSCPACGQAMLVAALSGRGSQRGWHWWCYNTDPAGNECKEKKSFAQNPLGRNQRRSGSRSGPPRSAG